MRQRQFRPPADGTANTEGNCANRVFRDGTFLSNAYMQRSARAVAHHTRQRSAAAIISASVSSRRWNDRRRSSPAMPEAKRGSAADRQACRGGSGHQMFSTAALNSATSTALTIVNREVIVGLVYVGAFRPAAE